MADRAAHRRSYRPAATAALLAIPLLFPASPTVAGPALELIVKANYLYKFAPFIDWPAGALGPEQAPFNLCVVGKDPFGDILDRVVDGQKVGEHPIVIKRMSVAVSAPACAIAFVVGSSQQSAAAALHVLAGASILTVTDGTNPRGVVDFVLDQGRVRFRLDVRAAAEHGLTIRSQLLDIATTVDGRRP